MVPYWITQNWFPVLLGMLVDHPLIMTASLNILYLPTHPTTPHPLHPKLKILVAHIWGNIESQNVSKTTQYILLSSRRKSSRGRYNSVLQQWHDFCGREVTNYLLPDVTSVLKFFTELYEKGCQYSSITLARSALESVVTLRGYATLSDHPLIKRFIKGVFHLRPPKPEYSAIWDADILLKCWQKMEDNSQLNLLELSKKVTTFDVTFITMSNDTCIFYPSELLKHDR